MGGIDEISLRLGELRAAVEEGNRQRTETLAKLDALHVNVNELKNDFSVHKSSAEARLNSVEGKVVGLQKIRDRALLMLAGVGLTGSAAGAAAGHVMKRLFGGS